MAKRTVHLPYLHSISIHCTQIMCYSFTAQGESRYTDTPIHTQCLSKGSLWQIEIQTKPGIYFESRFSRIKTNNPSLFNTTTQEYGFLFIQCSTVPGPNELRQDGRAGLEMRSSKQMGIVWHAMHIVYKNPTIMEAVGFKLHV